MLSALISLLLCPASVASPVAASEEFEASFLGTHTHVDVSRFAHGNIVLPGTYRVDVVVNRDWKGSQDIVFKAVPGHDSAQPCLSAALLASLGVSLNKVTRGDGHRRPEEAMPQGEFCGGIERYIPDASLTFISNTQTLLISVPQLFMDQAARGYVDPAQWDKGINAARLAYNASLSRSTGAFRSTRGYAGLNMGVNLDVWRLRHQGSYTWSSRYGGHYQNIATYAQRDIPSMHAQLVLGDTFTSGQVADSFRLRGVNLFSDLRMYPQSQQGYAPIVRGVAQSNARVSIRQNGYVIYETTEPPGPFEIKDLYATGYGGDLEVTVTETDGQRSMFRVPYTAIPQLLRPGMTLFSAAFGQLQEIGLSNNTPWVLQGTWQDGFNDTFTGFGSLTASQGYTQLGAGTAINTRYGGVALNVGGSHTSVPGNRAMQGYSVGVTFSRNLVGIGTDFYLGAYRFSSSGYLGVVDAASMRSWTRSGQVGKPFARQRSRLDLNISQRLGKGQLSLLASSSNYWGNGAARQTSYSLGYSVSFNMVSLGLFAQRARVEAAKYKTPEELANDTFNEVYYGKGYLTLPGRTDNSIMLTLMMRLGHAPHAPNLYSYLTRRTGSTPDKIQVGVNGVAGHDGTITYSASANRDIGQSSSQYFNTNIGYQSSYTNVRGGYSRYNNVNQVSLAATGGMVLYKEGLSFSQQLGNTIGLVEAKGAAGAKVDHAVGVHVSRHGYAVVPNLMPYQLNRVRLDVQGTSDDVELKDTSRSTVPRLGAVVKLKYDTVNGRAVVIRAYRANGEPLPFAATVQDEQGHVVGAVGQASKIFVRGIADQGVLRVKWGDTPDAGCRIDYQLPARKKGQQTADVVEARCVPLSELDKDDTQHASEDLHPPQTGTTPHHS